MKVGSKADAISEGVHACIGRLIDRLIDCRLLTDTQ